MRSRKLKASRVLMPAVTGGICMIMLMSAMNAVADWRNASPAVGDLIAFAPQPAFGSSEPEVMSVKSLPNAVCVLDTGVLRRSGGSFMIQSRIDAEDGVVIAHWAGPRTSEGPDDCGNGSELVLDREQLSRLASAAETVLPIRQPQGL
jgi:hypothetical protein